MLFRSLRFDGERFRVGPQSAGANPGPASYQRGGPLAVTDANVMVGKVQPRYFPKLFGPWGDEALDGGVVREKFAALAAQTGRVAQAGATSTDAVLALTPQACEVPEAAFSRLTPEACEVSGAAFPRLTPEACAEGFINIEIGRAHV